MSEEKERIVAIKTGTDLRDTGRFLTVCRTLVFSALMKSCGRERRRGGVSCSLVLIGASLLPGCGPVVDVSDNEEGSADTEIASQSYPLGGSADPDCIMYEHPNLSGNEIRVRAASYMTHMPTLNDKISSIWVKRGYYLVMWDHPEYGGLNHSFHGRSGRQLFGTEYVYGSARGSGYFINLPSSANDRMSSYRCTKNIARTYVFEPMLDPACVVCRNPNPWEKQWGIARSEVYPALEGWNDQISAVGVMSGFLLHLYEHPSFQGNIKTYSNRTPDYFYRWYVLPSNWNDKASALSCQSDPGYDPPAPPIYEPPG